MEDKVRTLTTEEYQSMETLATELEPWGHAQGDEYGEYLTSLCDLTRQHIPMDFAIHLFDELNRNIAWCTEHMILVHHEEEVITYDKWVEVEYKQE